MTLFGKPTAILPHHASGNSLISVPLSASASAARARLSGRGTSNRRYRGRQRKQTVAGLSNRKWSYRVGLTESLLFVHKNRYAPVGSQPEGMLIRIMFQSFAQRSFVNVLNGMLEPLSRRHTLQRSSSATQSSAPD